MKTLKRILAMVLCLALLQVPAALLSTPETVEAAAKEGLVYNKSNEKYYFYKDGKKVTNKWVTEKGEKYYFGKDGAAYAAEKFGNYKCNVQRKKINGKYYCFDEKGRMKKGLNVSLNGIMYFCNTRTGVVSPTGTNKYRSVVRERKPAKDALKILGKVLKKKEIDSCYELGKGVGYKYYFNRYVLETFKYYSNGKEIVTGLWPLD